MPNASGNVSSVTITRPANTTAYAAGDVVGQADTGTAANAGTGILEFTNIGEGMVAILCAQLRVDLTAVTSGMANMRLHLYSEAPAAVLDNAAWDLSAAGDRSKYLGYIDIGTPADVGSTLFVRADGLNMATLLVGTSIFGVLQTIGAYTPASGTVYTVTLRAVQL